MFCLNEDQQTKKMFVWQITKTTGSRVFSVNEKLKTGITKNQIYLSRLMLVICYYLGQIPDCKTPSITVNLKTKV